MTNPIPWKHSGDSSDERVREVSELLRSEGEAHHWSAQQQGRIWSRVEARIAQKRSFWRRRWLVPACAALVVIAFAMRWNARQVTPVRPKTATEAWQSLSLQTSDQVEILTGTEYRTRVDKSAAELEVFVRRGRLRAHVAPRAGGEKFVVATPHVRVVVIGTRFEVAVALQHSTVTVREGRVRVQRGEAEVSIGPGESIDSEDPRFASTLVKPKASTSDCHGLASLPERRNCYEREIKGSGLQAEAAILSLAQIERDEAHSLANMVRYLRLYRQRFPQGALAPEASLSLLQALVEQRRCPQALVEIDHIRRSFAQLEPLLDEALFYEAICRGLTGERRRARELFKRYGEQFPQGRHNGELPPQ